MTGCIVKAIALRFYSVVCLNSLFFTRILASEVADLPTCSHDFTALSEFKSNLDSSIRNRAGLIERNLFDTSAHGKTRIVSVTGVPHDARWVENPEKMIFRHYVESESSRENILETSSLRNSFVSYETVIQGVERKIYKELTGVFLTLPQVSPQEIGRPESGLFVDFRIPADIPVLEIEPGRIYLIPGPRRPRPWLLELYRRYQTHPRSLSSVELSYLRSIGSEDDLGKEFSIPIVLVD